MSKGERNRRIRKYAARNIDRFDPVNSGNKTVKSFARRIRRVGWFTT